MLILASNVGEGLQNQAQSSSRFSLGSSGETASRVHNPPPHWQAVEDRAAGTVLPCRGGPAALS